MWRPKYRHKIKQRPKRGEWVVQVIDGRRIVQLLEFNSCNAALSFVERREEHSS